MTHRLRVLRLAVLDIEHARDWYEGQRATLGDEFGRALDDLLGKVAERPLAWPVWLPDPSFRRAHLPRFP